jgi:8-oxo-dGTP pyrophosphatase MutT (NUDIX family)
MEDADRAIDTASEAGRHALEITRAMPGSDDKARAGRRLSGELRDISETASLLFQREVLRIYDSEGISYGRIARRLGVSKTLVYNIISKRDKDSRPQRAEGDSVAEPSTAPEPQPVVAAIVTSSRGVLVGRRHDGKPPWTFIAGEIEPGESPADAAVREVKEETGLRIRAGGVLGRRVHPKTGRLMVYMAAQPTHGTDAITGDEEELAEVRWVNLAEISDLMAEVYEPVRQHLKHMLGNGETGA